VTQLDIRPIPPVIEDKLSVWPYWPTKFRTSSSQARRGQSLVVWAIREGRQAARAIDLSLMGATDLPS
jgi:hypothetical protein